MDITSYLLGKKNGGVTPTGEVEITENGVHNVSGYATANVDVEPDLESKEVTITTNTTTNITPTQGKDGLSGVSVITNVQPNLETKSVTITQNKTTTITPTQGKDGMSSVEVTTNVEGSPYMRDTKAELDEINAEYGDYGLVYSQTVTYYQPSDGNIEVYFPDVVVLPETITETHTCQTGGLTSINLWEAGFTIKKNFFTYACKYSSEDGKVYTKTEGDDSGNSGTVSDASTFYDAMKYFMIKQRQANFDNVYQYTNQWEKAYMGLTAYSSMVLKNKTFFSDTGTGGVQTGTLSGDTQSSFSTILTLIDEFDTTGWTDITFTGRDYKYLGLIQALNTSNITSANGMFSNFKMKPIGETQVLDLTHFDMAKVTSTQYMFKNFGYDGTEGANDKLVLKLNANFEKVNYALNMFDNSKFDEIYLTNGNFGTSGSNQQLQSLFLNCTKLKKVSMAGANLSNITGIGSMCPGCTSLESIDLSVTGSPRLTAMAEAFKNCSSLLELDLSAFDLSAMSYCPSAFKGCTSLTKLDIRTLETGNISSSTDMFTGVPNNCEIKVKSQTVKDWILASYSNLTNIVIV